MFSSLQNQAQESYITSFQTLSVGSFPSLPRASFCQNYGPGKVTLMSLSGDNFTLHKPLTGSELHLFQNENKSLLPPQDASCFLPEYSKSCPNALKKRIK